MIRILTFLALVLSQTLAYAVTVSYTAEEVAYQYEATYRTLSREKSTNPKHTLELAAFHAAHVYGLFHSPDVSAAAGYPADLIEGFAGTKVPQILSAESFPVNNDPYLWVRYRARGTMVVFKPVLNRWLKGARAVQIKLPMIKDFPAIYSDDLKRYKDSKLKACTDTHYWQPEEFSYFYNPFRCPALGSEPIGGPTDIVLERISGDAEANRHFVPTPQIQSANGNGNLTVLYFANGFDSTPRPGSPSNVIHRDAGWKNFAQVDAVMTRKHGFQRIDSLESLRVALGSDFDKLTLYTPVVLEHELQRRFFRTYVKRVGAQIFVVRNALFSSSMESNTTTRSFPKFWKEAWENGDVIYYGGHSGDGAALNLDHMLNALTRAELEDIKFNQSKTQIVLFDSCSSYAHFQDMYMSRKPRGLHAISYGLVSLYHLAPATIEQLIGFSIDTSGRPLRWADALGLIERSQLPAHVQNMYEPKDRAQKLREYQSRDQFPTGLLVVQVPTR